MHKYNVGDRVVDHRYGNGVVEEQPNGGYSCYIVKFDDMSGINPRRICEDNMSKSEESIMNVGTFVKSSEYGIGRITEVNVGVCDKYIRTKFESGEHIVRANDVTSLYDTRRPEVGDSIFVCDNCFIGMGVVKDDDGSDLPFYVEMDDDTHWFYEHEVTLVETYVKPRFENGDIVRSNSRYYGEAFVGTVVRYREGSSLINNGRDVMMLNECIDKVEPEFNIGDKITRHSGITVHTITDVRPDANNTYVCYDTIWGNYDEVGSIYETHVKAYVKSPRDERIEMLKEELKILKDASHPRDCGSLDCVKCPFETKSGGCLSNDVRSAIEELKE